jgi:UPF0755 protein
MQNKTRRKSRLKILTVLVGLFLMLIVGGAFAGWRVYEHNLTAVSSSDQDVPFTIAEGASAQEIAGSLEQEGLIRASWAFELYVRKEGAREFLKAGTYTLSPNMSVSEIVSILTQGKISTSLVTILPGQRLDQIRDAFINQYDFDPSTVDAALNPNTYPNHPALADKPAEASLEGFLFPESFHRTPTTTPQDVIRGSLDEMHKQLTPDLKNRIIQQGLSMYQGITLASIIEKEVITPEDQQKVAQVFLTRLRNNMPLESNATAPYGSILAGQGYSESFTSPYNTYQHSGLPPTPVSNVTASALAAVANPAGTDFLYFFSGDDGRTHFSHTLTEHEARADQFCTRLCQ